MKIESEKHEELKLLIDAIDEVYSGSLRIQRKGLTERDAECWKAKGWIGKKKPWK